MFYCIKNLIRCLIPDTLWLRYQYRKRIGKKLNLKYPQTFNEKLQWLKLYDRNPKYTKMVDKYEVKKYVASLIGEKYIIPTLGVWDKFNDIDFDLLPEQFVLKCTHDSGGLVIVKDKKNFNKVAARKKISKCLKANYYWHGREWPYKNIKPRIIAEKYMEDGIHKVPEDYKIYCFNSKPKYIVVFHNRFDASKRLEETVYDVNWNFQNISLDEHFAISNIIEPKPQCLELLLKLATILSTDIAQSRIDFYVIQNNIYFGEITLFTASGWQKMIPEEMDMILGSQLDLKEFRRGKR